MHFIKLIFLYLLNNSYEKHWTLYILSNWYFAKVYLHNNSYEKHVSLTPEKLKIFLHRHESGSFVNCTFLIIATKNTVH